MKYLFGLLVTVGFLHGKPQSLQITETDDYNQWEEAKTAKAGADPKNFYKRPGFEVELLHSAEDDENSWVSCVFDPQGRLGIGREDKGILRYTFSKDRSKIIQKEWILQQVQECRGLLYAHGALYVNANKSNGIFRFRDLDGDGQFEEEKQLFDLPGGRGHGRNGMTLGPDGLIYAIMGDSVKLPFHLEGIRDHTSPLRRNQKVFRPNEGHVLRFDKDGKQPAIWCAGLRNPYDITFNAHGEAFTFDADAEHDMGSPWYRPTQIKHLTSGADFGWRAVTGSWPPYYPDHPDNTPALVDIGKSSPTGVLSGHHSHFPGMYQDAIFALDWTYGRILTIYLTPEGATYKGRPEVFLRGRPLNVTDADFGPDGAMYFVTGGRGTQSALYRVSYNGPPAPPAPPSPQYLAHLNSCKESRTQLKKLEQYHKTDAGRLPVPENLNDPRIRHATRIALEHQTAFIANPKISGNIDPSLIALTYAHFGFMTLPSRLTNVYSPETLRVIQLNFSDYWLDTEKQTLKNLFQQRPNKDVDLWVMTELMINLEMPEATPFAMRLMREAQTQRDRMHYLHILRKAKVGWKPELRREYFEELNASKHYLGGRGLPTFLKKIRKDAIDSLTEQEKASLQDLLNQDAKPELPPIPDLSHRKFVKVWKMDDFPKKLTLSKSTESGEQLFHEGLCSRCHRHRNVGFTIGPNLTQVSSRLGPRDLLQAILEPSQSVAENYQTHTIQLHDGKTLTGQIIPQLDYRSRDLLLAPNPLEPDKVTKIPKAQIQSHQRAETSIMPPSLLNTFTKEEILTMLAWLQ